MHVLATMIWLGVCIFQIVKAPQFSYSKMRNPGQAKRFNKAVFERLGRGQK